MPETTYDVLISGYGPVGQTAAALLGQAGHRVAAFERHAEPYPYARAGFSDHEVMRIFQSIGAADQIAQDAIVLRTYEWRSVDGELLMPFSFPDGSSGWESGRNFFQPNVERALDGAARAGGAEVHRGTEVVALRPGEDGVELDLRDGDGTRTVAGRYLIGADGASSFVRRAIDAEVVDLGFQYPWIVVDIEPLRPIASIKPVVVQVCDPTRPTTLTPLGQRHHRFEFMLMPGEDPAKMSSPEVVWDLLAPWITPDDAILLRHPVYTFEAKYVQDWRRGPVLLAGDAAHLMPPFLGQGMSSGVRDVKNLAWKLDLVLRGLAPESILDTYTPERRPQAKFIVEESVVLGRTMCITDPDEATARDQALRDLSAAGGASEEQPLPAPSIPPMDGDLVAEGEPLAGTLSIQDEVELDGARGLFDDVIGRGLVLLGRGGDPTAALTADNRAFIERMGAVVAHFGGDEAGAFTDVNGAYEAWLAPDDVRAVLLRPDFYVYGTARSLDDVPGLVDRLQARLTGSGTGAGRT
ncbi:MAG TPA: bifunctional 3-(3-hydroxy-phenyl)propionate/3-hydroxycinnamic acid hydroxylase [Baekduia sp.]|jgi:2-polyprenyl-6-methoxyphenol hydroxylase-like FAD-dependent oxidoreductase|nr:bifunctional 3-(3-hydroxy-phenyl)propionate/3-hydroxycinnamic acid hydroxylase [Baekduia sp.]